MYKKFNQTTKQARRPLLISEQKWKAILEHLIDRKAIQSCEEKQYYEYLKNGSENMTKNWTNTIAKSIEKAKEKKNAYQEKINEDLRLLSKIKEQDENVRREKIQKANLVIQKLLPGPRELESAAMTCEVLRGRQIQIALKNKIKKEMNEDKICDRRMLNDQVGPYMKEEEKRIEAEKERKQQFKNDLIETIKNNRERNEACRKIKNEGERKILELMKEDEKTYDIKEKAIKIAKKNIVRQQILEDILQKKDKCRRTLIEDQIVEELNKTYNEKQQKFKNLLIKKITKEKCERMCFIEKNAKKHHSNLAEIEKAEEQRRLKKIEEEEKKFEMREKNEEMKRKLNREERIQDYMNYLKRKEQNALEQRNIFNWELANRLKNCDVNDDYTKQIKVVKIQKQKETAKILKDQMKEQKTIHEYDKVPDNRCNSMNFDLQDKFFFDYGDQLMEHAKNKCRPLYPLQKAIASYKKVNSIEKNIVVPAELQT